MSEITVEKIILEISSSDEVVVLEISDNIGASIDDSAGLGVTDKTWSANKIKTEIDSAAGVPFSMFNTLENTVYGVMATADNNTQAIIDVNTRIDTLDSKVDINTVAILNKVDKEEGKGLSSNDFSDEDKVKLGSVATDATENATDDFLLDRGNHTGVQPIASVDGLQLTLEALESDVSTLFDGKVDKQDGKGLSDTNFTQSEKDKLSSLESSKFVGLFVSESALPLSGIEGDYANVDGGVGSDVYRVIWDSSDSKWVRVQGVSTELTDAQIKQQYESNPDTNAFTDDEKAKLDSVANNATANRSDTLNADKVHSHVINDVVGLVDQLNLKAPISDTITRAEYQLLFAKVASVETLLMSLVGSIYVT